MQGNAISIRELAFVRDVLIPRAWVQGGEVDELLRLRTRIDGIFSALREQVPQPEEPPTAPTTKPVSPTERKKKPRHPKKRRGQPLPPKADES